MQKILVVEDDFDIRELLQNFLQEAGYEAVSYTHLPADYPPGGYEE